MTGGTRHDRAVGAKFMVLVVGLAWGFNWVAGRIILTALPPWTMRMVGIGLGTLSLFAAAAIWRVRLTVPRAEAVKISRSPDFQRRRLQCLFRLRAGVRDDIARHRHRLFDADLGRPVGARRA